MTHHIQPGRLLTEDEARQVKAAFALAGLDQKSFADEKAVSYSRVNRMLSHREAVTPQYARLFSALVRTHLHRFGSRSRQAA